MAFHRRSSCLIEQFGRASPLIVIWRSIADPYAWLTCPPLIAIWRFIAVQNKYWGILARFIMAPKNKRDDNASVLKQLEDVFSEAFVKQLDELLEADEERVGVVGKWEPIEKLLTEHGFITVEKGVLASEVLVHKDNRSRLMLTPVNCHGRLAGIKAVGCSRAELERHAIATRLCPLKPYRDLQVDANIQLVNRANNLLAPVNGLERICSLGSSHATAGLKAAFAGVPTPEPSLKSESSDGCVDVAAWRSTSPAFANVQDEGFDWKVIDWPVELRWPQIPDLASRAYNGSGAVASGRGEMEVACHIARLAQDARDSGKVPDYKACTTLATTVPAQCNVYAEVMACYARLYAGGADAPYLYSKEKWITMVAGGRHLCEEVWKMITYAKWGQFEPRVLIRAAILGAAYTCATDKVKDGLCKIFNQNDIAKLTSKKYTEDIQTMSTMMQKARGLVGNHDRTENCIDRLDSRLVLCFLAKGKHGFEGVDFPSLESVGKAFVFECRAAGLSTLECPMEWADADIPKELNLSQKQAQRAVAAHAAPSAAHVGVEHDAVTADTMESPMFIVAQRGFVKGTILVDADTKSYWKIMQITDCETKLKQCVPFGPSSTRTVATLNVMDRHRPFKGVLQSQIGNTWMTDLVAGARDASKIDMVRTKIFAALQTLEIKNVPSYAMLMPLESPTDLRASCHIAKGTLRLAPVVPLRFIVASKPAASGSVCLGTLLSPPSTSEDVDFFIVAYSGIPKHEHKEMWVCPYFWVKDTSDEDAANCKLVEATVDGYKFPTIVNYKPIKTHAQILMCKPEDTEATASVSAAASSKRPGSPAVPATGAKRIKGMGQ